MDVQADHTIARPQAVPEVTLQSSSAILGKVAWLMMESAWHRGRRVEDFARLVMPAIGSKQFRLYHDGDVPIAFVSWVRLSPEAEQRYLEDPLALAPEDWTSGESTYLADFVVSKGAFRRIVPHLLRDPLLTATRVRGLRIRNGKRILVELYADAMGRHVRTIRLDH